MSQPRRALITALTPAMQAAGRLAMARRAEGLVVRQKEADDGHISPVSNADGEAEALLVAAIRAIDPKTPIVGEEESALNEPPRAGRRFWLIDPIDGTRAYVAGGSDFSVNIGLIEEGVPTLGLILHPPTDTLWAGASGVPAFRQSGNGSAEPVRTRPLAATPLVLLSRSNRDEVAIRWANAVPRAMVERLGCSLKFCRLADGSADLYPRTGRTSEWDTAAGDALLRAAGGLTLGADGQPFRYGKEGYRNGALLAVADPAAVARMPRFSFG